jgi:dCTP deaminase
MLSNVDIWRLLEEGKIVIRPRPPKQRFAGASVDLTLAPEIRVLDTSKCPFIDYRIMEKEPDYLLKVSKPVTLPNDAALVLHPGKVIICSTAEWIEIPDNISAELHGRSSLARIGILPHTAGKIDPGWKGRLTLEVSNVSEIPVALYPGVAICQIVFHELSSPADLSYKEATSRYQGQEEPSVAGVKALTRNSSPV